MKASFSTLNILIIASFLLYLSCSKKAEDVIFIDRDGARYPLFYGKASSDYRLKKSLEIPAGKLAFYLQYRESSGLAVLRLYSDNREVLKEVSLPAVENTANRILIPLAAGSSVWGFEIELRMQTAPAPDRPNGSASPEILEAGLQEDFKGFEQTLDRLTIGSGIESIKTSSQSQVIAFSEEMFFQEKQGQVWQILLEVSSQNGEDQTFEESESLFLSVSGENKTARFKISNRSGRRLFFFYPGLIPFKPETLSINRRQDLLRTRINRLEVSFYPADEPLDPLPADPGLVLHYNPGLWRRNDFELFSWNRLPEILIFDTAGYEVQDRLFKRIAFFLEKKGFRGRITRDEEIRLLHGYNAHDYRAEDLARFFRKAEEEDFPLNDLELVLRDILIRNGIIRREEGMFLPGRGGILSISRSSSPALRRHLLTHESFHGIFFSSPEYRKACFLVWNELSDEERDFWRLFFNWASYDITDSYLVVNEFQAYLFQQEREDLNYYFKELTAGRLLNSYPDKREWVEAFFKDFPNSFEESFDRLEVFLRDTAHFEGGKVMEVLPRD